MGHTYTSCMFHVVFSTKERRPQPIENMRHLHRYLVGIAKKNGFDASLVGGTTDHVHILLSLPPTIPLSKAVQLLKGGSSKWYSYEYPSSGFSWQEGFAAFSVSRSQFDAAADYVRNQEKHHEKRDFAAEFVALLEKHGVAYDPKYVLG
jgi:REP element-mobilizing transposase RayT